MAKKKGNDPGKIKEEYDEGRKFIEAEIQRYWINLSYFYGEQWVSWNKSHGRVMPLERDPARARVTVNRLRPESRRILSKLLKRDLRFQVAPTAADDASVQGAKLGAAVLESERVEQRWEQVRREHANATWLGGTGLLCLDWNPSAGDNYGQSTTGEDVHAGAVELSSLTVAEAVTIPGARNIERAPWWIKAQALPPEVAKYHFGLSKTPAADSSALAGAALRVMSSEKRAPVELTLVLTRYERPCDDYPEGRIVVSIGNEIVAEQKWPFPFKDRLNLVCARETLAHGRWTGDTVYTDAVPIQTAYNAVWSSIVEHQKRVGNARIMVPDTALDIIDELTDTPGEVVPYNSSAGKPEYMRPPDMPQWWTTLPQLLEGAMDNALAQHDASRGEAPRNIESGLGISILVEQADTPAAALAQELARCWGDIAGMVLQTLSVMVTEQRQAIIQSRDMVPETKKWTGQDLAGQFHAYVPADAVAPMSDAARKAQGFNLWDRKVITDPRSLAAYIDLGEEASFIEATDHDVAKARRENHELLLGKPVVPADFDDHSKHILEHNQARKTSRYEDLPEQEQGVFDMHVVAHEQMAAEEMGKQVARGAAAPALAGTAQATEPPGSATGPPLPEGFAEGAAQEDGLATMDDMANLVKDQQEQMLAATEEAMAQAEQDAATNPTRSATPPESEAQQQ